MIFTIFLTLIFIVSITIMLISAVAFVQNKKFFSSAPKEAKEVLQDKEHELFKGAHAFGYVLWVFSVLMIVGVFGIGIYDGVLRGYDFWQYFIRFIIILDVYKIYDMIFFDYFLLMKFHFFQYYYPEVESVYSNRKYGYNLPMQLIKLLILFPGISALLAYLCSLIHC